MKQGKASQPEPAEPSNVRTYRQDSLKNSAASRAYLCRIVDIGPLYVRFVEGVVHAGGNEEIIRQLVGSVEIDECVVLESYGILRIGKPASDVAQTATYLERQIGNIANAHPEIGGPPRNVRRLMAAGIRACVGVDEEPVECVGIGGVATHTPVSRQPDVTRSLDTSRLLISDVTDRVDHGLSEYVLSVDGIDRNGAISVSAGSLGFHADLDLAGVGEREILI